MRVEENCACAHPDFFFSGSLSCLPYYSHHKIDIVVLLLV